MVTKGVKTHDELFDDGGRSGSLLGLESEHRMIPLFSISVSRVVTFQSFPFSFDRLKRPFELGTTATERETHVEGS